jgi:hypothetical protein
MITFAIHSYEEVNYVDYERFPIEEFSVDSGSIPHN